MNVPLVTTSPPASLGVLGAPGTEVLFGDSGFNYEAFSGARLTLGIWLFVGLSVLYLPPVVWFAITGVLLLFFLGVGADRKVNFAIVAATVPETRLNSTAAA